MSWLVRFAIAALLPASDQLPGAADMGLAAFVRQFLRETSWMMWLGVVAGSAAFMLSPIITIGAPVPAFVLPRRWLDRHASRFASHRVYLVRQAAVLLKIVAGLVWAAHPEVRQSLQLRPYADDPGSWRTT